MPRRSAAQIITQQPTEDENTNPNENRPQISEESIQSIRDPALKDLLRGVQLQADTQRRENERLKRDLEEIEAAQPRKKRRNAHVVDKDGRTSLDDECRRNGKMFLLMYRPWVLDEDILQLPFSLSDNDEGSEGDSDSEVSPSTAHGVQDLGPPVSVTGGSDPDAEYLRTQNRIEKFEKYERQVVPKEYRKCLTPDLHDRHDDLTVIAVFVNGMDNLRSTLVHRIRKEVTTFVLHDYNIGDIINAGLLGSANASSNARLQELLGYNITHQTYDILAPYLYLNEDTSDPEGLFRAAPLMLCLRACLFGGESIRGNSNVAKKSMGYQWSIKQVTSGSIAFASILVMYTLSADSEFTPQGSKTGINYLLAFRELKALVDRFADTPFGKETLRLWQRSVFEGQPTSDIAPGQASLSGLEKMWEYIEGCERAQEELEDNDGDSQRDQSNGNGQRNGEDDDEDDGEDENGDANRVNGRGEVEEDNEDEEIPRLSLRSGRRPPLATHSSN